MVNTDGSLRAPKRRPKTQAALLGCALALLPVAGHEGLQLAAYRDPIGIPTVCYGETEGVKLGMKFTKAECQTMLEGRLQEFAAGVESCIRVPMKPEVWGAMISFAYNLGVPKFCKSSVANLLNAGQTRAACDRLLKFNTAGGIPLRGLTTRRQQERAECLKGS